MSINVTVKGNPISVNSGNIATSSVPSNDTNDEIKKRRQMRLQQVRQQSKDIAQNIRDKVKKENEKQISQASHENATKLKQWQNKKLIQLQSQYQAGLNEIGLGHIQAAEEEKREDVALVEQDKRKKDAKERGFQASQKVQIARNEQNMKKALPIQHKKFARDVEDTRAAMVSQLKNKSPREREKRMETENSTSDSNVDLGIEVLNGEILSDAMEEEPSSHEESHSVEDSVVITTTVKSPRKHRSKDLPQTIDTNIPVKSSTQSCRQDTDVNRHREEENRQNYPSTGATQIHTGQFYLDTRISDRIKSRLLPFPETKKLGCGSNYDIEIEPRKSICCPCPDRNIMERVSEFDTNTHVDQFAATSKSAVPKSTVSDKVAMRSLKSHANSSQRTKDKDRNTTSTLTQPVVNVKAKGIEVPLKPPVALISSNETLSHLHSLPPQPTNISRVQYYDHRNRYNTEYLTDNANILKIADENVVRLTDPPDNVQDTELRLRRDREAHLRGQKAMEKERIHRDYSELLQKLPVLQKQERIACLCRDKPTFHMNKERLQETELKRQNVMENAYEHLFANVEAQAPKLKVIPDPNNMPFKTIHNPDSTSMRLGDNKGKEPQTGLDENQTNLLHILLQNLQQQKEMLQQLESSSKQQSSQSLVGSKKSSGLIVEKRISECDCLPVKALILQNTSTQTSPAQTSRTSRTSVDITASSPKRPHTSVPNEADESSSPKKAKKIRNKTQMHNKDIPSSLKSTSAPTDKTSNKSSPSNNTDSSIPVEIYKQSKVKYKCDCETPASCGQLCEIRIRIQDNEKPEIIITSPKKKKTARTEIPSSKPVLKIPSRDEASSKSGLRASSVNDRKRSKTADKSSPQRVTTNKTPLTWGEQFTQNSSSSSTTYYSPPIMQHTNAMKPKVAKGSIKSKSATDSSGVSQKHIDRRLMTYISKLLDLSKAQIDDLNVTSVSEVTTPNSSVIDCCSNRPMKQLMNVMKLFKLSPLDIATNLNYSKDSSPVGCINSNTSSGISEHDARKSPQTEPVKNRVQYFDSSTSSKYCSDNSKSTTESGGFFTKYTDMTNNCHQRISDLTAEIEKIRQEKQQILESHSESDKENSTVYCNLPSQLGQSSNRGVSPHSLEEQEELNKKLLRIKSPTYSGHIAADIDYNDFFKGVDDVDKDIMERYIKLKTDVDKLIVDKPESFEELSQFLTENSDKPQTFSSQFQEQQMQLRGQIMENSDPPVETRVTAKTATKDAIFSVNNVGRDILDSLSNLKSDVNELTVQVPGPSQQDPEVEAEERHDLCFVPLLDDIPRLPKFGTAQVTEAGKRPPPSKGLIAARKFKGDIMAPPHELSTIAEADSLISAKCTLKQTRSSCCTKSCSSSCSSEDSMPDLLAELIGKVNVTDDFKGDITKRSDTDTSTEKSDLETIENMLRSIGMDWAIATLRKTRDTLGRNSSSSSATELSVKPSDFQNNDCISITESTVGNGSITGSQHSSQSCCSTFGKEIDLSQISGGTSNTIDNCNRTSTPVSKGKCKSKNIDSVISDDSDRQPIPENTDDHYLTIPDVSLKSHSRTE